MYKRKRSSTGYTNTPYKRPRTTPGTQAVIRKEVAKANYKNVEMKYLVVGIPAPLAVTNAGTVYLATSGLARGDGVSEFEGQKVVPKHLRVRYSWNSSLVPAVARIIILQWFDSSVPTAALVLPNTGAVSVVLDSTTINSKPLMKVLYDKTIPMFPQTTGISRVYTEEVFISDKRMRPIKFKAATNDPQYGALYMVVWTDAAASAPAFIFKNEFAFTD